MIFIVFPASGGRKMTAELPFVEGQTLRHYLRNPELRKYNTVHLALRSQRLDENRRRLRMRSQLTDGTTVYLMQTGQT